MHDATSAQGAEQQQQQQLEALHYISSDAPVSTEEAPLSTQKEVVLQEGAPPEQLLPEQLPALPGAVAGQQKNAVAERQVEAAAEEDKPAGPAPAAHMQRHRATMSEPALPEAISFVCESYPLILPCAAENDTCIRSACETRACANNSTRT